MLPKLIFALDTTKVDQASHLARMATAGGADIIEVGTPLIKIEGVKIVKLLHTAYLDIPIHADLKVIDFPDMEITDFFSAGASSVSVMAFANNNNILKALEIARSYGGEIFVSTMEYPNFELKNRVEELSKLGVNYIIAHASGDPKDAFNDLLQKIKILRPFDNFNLIVAGGINEGNISLILSYHPKIIIIGRGISTKKDVTSAVMRIKGKILNYHQKERGV
ncbi:hypothetical protein BEH94_07380 [Candidatus Altiarchaeales archaeon WOR_SM1_SCG]|nr:hypothetical protein BEH94_07380 [Candidatus Altiarchaeales archaeon WOR_SM1_SCG]